MPLPRSIRTWGLTQFAVLLFANLAHAGMAHRDCRYPIVFEDAAVNVVVLPYRYAGGNNYSLTNMGNRLSLLVKLDVLSHILDYGSVGAVQMEMPEGALKDDPSCLPETVLQRLLGMRPPDMSVAPMFAATPGSVTTLRSGHGLVLVWGLLYEEGDDVFVQTYARFLRRNSDEGITFQVGGSSFSAKPSSQLLAFTPQKFTQSELKLVEDGFRKANYVRDQPDDSARGDQLPELVAKCAGSGCDDSPVHAGFYVQEKRGEWIRIQYMDPTQGRRKEGWVHAAGGLEGTPLDRILPELKFIEGCAGYLRQRVADAEHVTLPPAPAALAVTQLNGFVQSNDIQPMDITNAVALQLEGIVESVSGHDRVDPFAKAADDFERARKMIPYDPNAITLAVATQVAREWSQRGRCDQTALKAKQLSAASALTSDKAALGNLSNLYTLLLKSPDSPDNPENLSKAEVRNRLDVVNRVTFQK